MKPIVPVASPVVNYLTYIQAYCSINWRLADNELKVGVLSENDKSFMQECSKHFRFGDGSGGALAGIFYFLPAYIYRGHSTGFEEFLGCLERCCDAGSSAPLFNDYGSFISRIDEFNSGFSANIKNSYTGDTLSLTKHLSLIYRQSFPLYLEHKWDDDKAAIESTSKYIIAKFSDDDVIGRWEAATGLELQADQYQLILVPSLKFGPGANSLHYGVNIFPAISEYCPSRFFDYFVPHEIGTHIIKHLTLDKYTYDEHDSRIYYIAFENLAKFLNFKILTHKYQYELGEEYYADSKFQSIYALLEMDYHHDISGMYLAAIDKYVHH